MKISEKNSTKKILFWVRFLFILLKKKTRVFLLVKMNWRTSRCVVASVLNYKIAVGEFELQSRYNVHFPTNPLEKGMNPPCPPSKGYIVSPLLFYKTGFVIK